MDLKFVFTEWLNESSHHFPLKALFCPIYKSLFSPASPFVGWYPGFWASWWFCSEYVPMWLWSSEDYDPWKDIQPPSCGRIQPPSCGRISTGSSRTAASHVWDAATAAASSITLAFLRSSLYWACCCQIELRLLSIAIISPFLFVLRMCQLSHGTCPSHSSICIFFWTLIDTLDIFPY